MLLLRTERLPEGRKWLYELKLDGYRAIAAKARGRVHSFRMADQPPGIASSLCQGRPFFNQVALIGLRWAAM